MNNGNIKGKSTSSETSPQSNMARDKLTMGKGNHKHDGSTNPTMKCDVLQYHDCTNVTVNDDVEIIDTKVIDALPVDADKCKHCLTTGKWQTIIRAKCCHIPTEFLLDSGASLNVLSSQFIAKLPSKCIENISRKNIIIHGVASSQIKVERQVRLTFSVNGTKFTDDFHVIPNNYNILGNPFLTKNKAIINFDTTEVTLNGSKFPMYAPSTRSTTVKTVSDLFVAAFSIQEIRVKLTKRVISDNMLVTGLNSIEQRYPGLTIVPAMVNSQNTLLRVVNETNTPVCLASNTALGIARNFNPNAITQFADFYEETECPSCTGIENECLDIETAPELPDTDSSNQCPNTTIQHCDSCQSTGQSEVNSIDRSSQCCVHDRGVSNQAEPTLSKSGIPHSNSDQQGSPLRSNHPHQAHNFDAIPNSNPGGYYRCTQNPMPKPKDKIPSVPPQRDSDINDPSEPFDDYLKFNIANDNLSAAEIKDFEIFLFSNDKRFSVTRENMGYNVYHPHIVDVEGQNPSNMRKCRYYRLTPFMQKFMDKEIATLLKLGFIEASTSSWRSPALLVKKPNGDFRLVVNYKNLNKLIKPQHFPLVTAEELWCEMGQQKPRIFSTLDLFSGFHQIALDEDSKEKTTFVVRSGLYQWTCMPMGLANAPAAFGRTMSTIFKDMLFKNMCFYADDLIVYSDCLECHKRHLQQVFDRLEKANMTLKASKCFFAKPKTLYLGHVLSENGIEPNPQLTEIIEKYPVPKTAKHVRQFLGLTQYYRRFQKDYSKIAHPLQQLTKKDVKFSWTPECQKAFDTLRHNLMNPPILAYPDMSRNFIVTTDASDFGLGCTLSQEIDGKEHVIQYSGRSLRPAEINYSVSEKEALSIVSAFKHFHYYLYNSHTIVRTDHTAVKYIKEQDSNTRPRGRIARWILELQGYDFEIQYRPGKSNAAADALSRLPSYPPSTKTQPHISSTPIIMTTDFMDSDNAFDNVNEQDQYSEPQLEKFEWCEAQLFETETLPSHEFCFDLSDIDLPTEQQNGPVIGDLYRFIDTGLVPAGDSLTQADIASQDQYAIMDGVLIHFYQPRVKHKDQFNSLIKQIVVPEKYRARLLKEYHASLAGGCHQGSDRLFLSIRQKYYWKRMWTDIHEFQKSCDKCQRASHYHPPKQPLHPLPVPHLFERLHLDYLGPLRTSSCGKKWILLVIDAFSGWTECFALESADAITTAQVFYQEVITRYGCPKYILTDRGATFLSTLLRALCQILGIQRISTSSYHPASNSKVERFNRFLWKSLRTLVDKNQLDWPKYLPGIMMAYRATPSANSTGFSPYFLCFAKDMVLPIDNVINPTVDVSPNFPETFMESVKMAREIAHENLVRHHEESKKYYDLKTKDPQYKVGQYVWLFDPTTPVGYSAKLKPRYIGPYVICEANKNHTYRLRNYNTGIVTDNLINAQRIKPAYLPWTSRIRTTDPDRQRNANDLRQGQQAPADRQAAIQQPQPQPRQQQQGNNNNNQPQGQGQGNGHSNRKTNISYHDKKVEQVVDLKKQNKVKWYRVKFKNIPGTKWFRDGALNIPQGLIDKCLQHRTWAGKPRKRKIKT